MLACDIKPRLGRDVLEVLARHDLSGVEVGVEQALNATIEKTVGVDVACSALSNLGFLRRLRLVEDTGRVEVEAEADVRADRTGKLVTVANECYSVEASEARVQRAPEEGRVVSEHVGVGGDVWEGGQGIAGGLVEGDAHSKKLSTGACYGRGALCFVVSD